MFFDHVPQGLPDPIFGLNDAFQKDPRSDKVNLIIGIYKDEQLISSLMPSVKEAKQQVFDQDLLADYLSIDGLQPFIEEVGLLAFGEILWKAHHSRIYAAQTIGGTGALQVGGQFLAQEVGRSIAISSPTWPNHRSIFERAGFSVDTYPYYERQSHGVAFEKLLASCRAMPPKTVVLLHPACHNPTGCDLSIQQWKELSVLFKEKQLVPFFDFAYQGLGDGIEKDRRSIEIFFDDGHEMLIAYSCAKNFSLYCQRVGALFVVAQNASEKGRVGSQIKRIIRSLYSNPPAHGARIVASLLKSAALKTAWLKDLEAMRHRIAITRKTLVDQLEKISGGDRFEFLRNHKGMFSFVDLDLSQVHRLIEDHGIYLIDNGRISLAGLNHQNIDRVVSGIVAVCK